ncbi:lasso peptide biosynthesis PqqD family chaperone [Saccharopolyspora taberi]|uniref:Lasso peptide biosynthesis PqqD family chaperone n=1 Tax=Saccharopolyspora taberi TaxID=60895 RepID=A0ABN3VC28_9PSEU
MPLRLRPDVATTETADGTVLLQMSTGRYFQLNTTGTAVLHALLEGHDTAAIAERLATRHGIDPGHAHRDVTTILQNLRDVDLVEPR